MNIENFSINQLNKDLSEFYEKNNIKIFHEEAAQELDFKSQRVQTSKRKNVPFDKLLIALGSSNKKFVKKGVNTENFFYLRDINESKKIKEIIKNKKQQYIQQ